MSDELQAKKAINGDSAKHVVSSATVARVTLHTVSKVNTELRNDLIGIKVTVQEVGYPKELDMRCSTVV